MSESEMVAAAELDVYPDAAAAMTEVGDGWFGRERAVKAARHALTCGNAVWRGTGKPVPRGVPRRKALLGRGFSQTAQ